MLQGACGDKDRICDPKALVNVSCSHDDDSVAHTSVAQFKAWEFTKGAWGLHLAEGEGIGQQPSSGEVSQETSNQKAKATSLSGPVTGGRSSFI